MERRWLEDHAYPGRRSRVCPHSARRSCLRRRREGQPDLEKEPGSRAGRAHDVGLGLQRIASDRRRQIGQRWSAGGSRTTPTLDGARVYALTPQGDLVCAGAAKGNLIWKKNLAREL